MNFSFIIIIVVVVAFVDIGSSSSSSQEGKTHCKWNTFDGSDCKTTIASVAGSAQDLVTIHRVRGADFTCCVLTGYLGNLFARICHRYAKISTVFHDFFTLTDHTNELNWVIFFSPLHEENDFDNLDTAEWQALKQQAESHFGRCDER